MAAPEGVSSADFTEIMNDLGRSITFKTATSNKSNITASEEITYVDSTVTAVVLKEKSRFIFDREGILDMGDAYMMVSSSQPLKKGDRVVFDGETYEITPTSLSIIRKFTDTTLYNFATLRKTTGTQV